MTETTGDGVVGDATGETPTADDAGDGVVLTEPTAPPRRSRLGTALRWGGVAAGVAGIVLAVLGVLAFSSASSDDDAAEAVKRRTKVLAAQEREADGNSREVFDQGGELGDEINALNDASLQLLDAQNQFVDAMNAAIDLYNNGRTGDARAAFDAQGGAVADLEQRLAKVQRQLAAAHERLAAISAGGGS